MSVEVGQEAPVFEVRSDSMEAVKLSALRGQKLLLLFVPLAFTST
jgi:peroxiredoxin